MGEYLGRKIPVEELIEALEQQYRMFNGMYDLGYAEIASLEKKIKQLHASVRGYRDNMNKIAFQIEKLREDENNG